MTREEALDWLCSKASAAIGSCWGAREQGPTCAEMDAMHGPGKFSHIPCGACRQHAQLKAARALLARLRAREATMARLVARLEHLDLGVDPEIRAALDALKEAK